MSRYHEKVEKLVHTGQVLDEVVFSDFTQDAVNIKGSNTTVNNCAFLHTSFEGDHGDAIQLIPGVNNQQYALDLMEDVTISGCTVSAADTDIQGIFASDGLFRGLKFTNNTIKTRHHGITINGALSVLSLGNEAIQQYYPARVGGGIAEQKIWIIGFDDDDINYEPIISNTPFLDLRQEIFNEDDIFLTNFRYWDYRTAAEKIPAGKGDEVALAAYTLALEYGDIVMNSNDKVVYTQPVENQKRRPRRKLLDVVLEELHEREIAGPDHNPNVTKYWDVSWHKPGNDDDAWCMVWLQWCFREAGLPYLTSPRALDCLNWGKLVPLHKLKPGDVLVKDYGNGRGHVAILLQETATHYKILGGNQRQRKKDPSDTGSVNASWWPKVGDGVWHGRRSKQALFSKTAITSLLEAAGLAGGAGYGASEILPEIIPSVVDKVKTTAPSTSSRVTEIVTEINKPYEIPEGYMLLPSANVNLVLIVIGTYMAITLLFTVIRFRDRLKNIFDYGV